MIELLQGRPPYSDLDSMSALFHIVDDEHPPFPDGASAAARDFLMRCFQKDPNLRTTAKKLRKHDWITNHARSSSQSSISASAEATAPGYNEAVTSVKVYNQKVNGPDLLRKQSGDLRTDKLVGTKPKTSPARRKPFIMQKHVEQDEDDWGKDLEIKMSSTNKPALKLRNSKALSRDKENPCWDQDFDLPTAKFKQRKDVPKEIPPFAERRNLHKTPSLASMHRRRSPDKLAQQIEELTIRPSSAQLLRKAGPAIDTAKKIKQTSASSSPSSLTPRRIQRTSTRDSLKAEKKSNLSLQQFVDEQEGYDDMLDDRSGPLSALTNKSHSGQFPDRGWMQDEDAGDDPFAEIEEFEKENLTANVMREQKARASHQVETALRAFQANITKESMVMTSLSEIRHLMDDHPEVKSTIISSHGLLPLLELLETNIEDELILLILEILNSLAHEDEEVQENIAFVGGISSITKFAHRKYTQEIRMQSAIFVKQILASSDLNAQIFVSCRGLNILTEFLEEDYYEAKTLVSTGIEGTLRVFSLQGKYTPKNDLCRIMARTGVLEPLTHTLHVLLGAESSPDHVEALTSILQIMLNFAQADQYVKNLIATRNVLKRLLMDLRLMRGDHLITCLKFIKSLSSVSSTLEVLHNANAIERLVQLLSNTAETWYQEAANHVLTTLFNLCRIDKARQTEAAFVGIIPILKRIVAHDRPLKDLAIPMLCTMAHNSDCRKILWSQNGLDFYLNLLADASWQVNAFEAIVIWFFEESARVERKLIESSSIEAIIAAFGSARGVSFESLLDQLQKLLKASRKLSRSISTADFMRKLIQRLDHQKPTIRAHLLKILQCVLDAQVAGGDLIKRYSIIPILTGLSTADSAVIVRALAKTLLSSLPDAREY